MKAFRIFKSAMGDLYRVSPEMVKVAMAFYALMVVISSFVFVDLIYRMADIMGDTVMVPALVVWLIGLVLSTFFAPIIIVAGILAAMYTFIFG